MRKLAALALLLLLCCAPPSRTAHEVDSAYRRVPQSHDVLISFASLQSQMIERAALRFPKTRRARAVSPVALTATDGSGLTLTSYRARTVVDGPLAFTELSLRFRNPRPEVIEGRFSVTLPTGAAVSRLAMMIDNRWQEAEVVEKQRARKTYEQVLHQGLDPALLERKAGNAFNARIFPIPANGEKHIILSYSQTLDRRGSAYTLPLRGLPAVEELDVEVQVRTGDRFETKQLKEQHVVPQKDLSIPATASRQGLHHGDLVALQVRPPLSGQQQTLNRMALLFDTSASRALGFKQQVHKLGALVAQLRKLHGDELRLHVATFDQRVTPVFAGAAKDFGKQQLREVRSRRALGASNLRAALRWLDRNEPLDRAVLLTDGVATLGPREATGLRKTLQQLKVKPTRLDVVIDGGIRDERSMRTLVVGPLAEHGAVLDGRQSAATLARRISLQTRSGIEVRVPGAEWVWPSKLDGLQPGDDALVFARLKAGDTPKQLQVKLGGSVDMNEHIELRPAVGPLLQRAAARASIERLSVRLSKLSKQHGRERSALKRRIIELSKKHRVLSDHTALLVLETEADYRRFGIDRNALADILVIGPQGIEHKRRSTPAKTMVKGPTNQPPPSGPKADGAADKTPSPPGTKADPAPAKPLAAAAKPPAAAAKAPDPPANPPPPPTQSNGRTGSKVSPSPIRVRPGPARRTQHSRLRAALRADRSNHLQPLLPRPSPKPAHAGDDDDDDASYGYTFNDDPSAAPITGPSEPSRARARSYDYRFSNDSLAGGTGASASPPSGDDDDDDDDDGALADLATLDPDATVALNMEEADSSARAAPRRSAFQRLIDNAQPYSGRMAEVMKLLDPASCAEDNCVERAVTEALAWRNQAPGDVMALVGLGEALEARGHLRLAARAYGSIIDLYPGRAEMQRFAAGRLVRLGKPAATIAQDAYAVALKDRPDHLTAHRANAYVKLRAGNPQAAFNALDNGFRRYPEGRFAGGIEVLRSDLGLIGAAWLRADPKARGTIEQRLSKRGAVLATRPSLRFVLSWETDANDVDLHVADGKGGHAYYERRTMSSGGRLLEDITTGFGPELFIIDRKPTAYPYHLLVHYYSRGAMGFGMGTVEIIEHDGKGQLRFETRPFVVMRDGGYVYLGKVDGPL